MRLPAMALGILFTAGACATTATSSTDQSVTAATTTHRNNIITNTEVRESKAVTLAQLITQSGRNWPRAEIYLDNNPDPSGTALQRAPSTIKEIRYYTKSEAQMKFGSRIRDAVLQIVTR